MISAREIRAARSLLGMKQSTLAELSGMTVTAVTNIERGATAVPHASTLRLIQQALEEAGIEFISEDERGGAGVRLRKR